MQVPRSRLISPQPSEIDASRLRSITDRPATRISNLEFSKFSERSGIQGCSGFARLERFPLEHSINSRPTVMAAVAKFSDGTDALNGPAVRKNGAGGCLKCGQFGHWARDCTATPEEIKRMKDMKERENVDGEAGANPTTAAPLEVAAGRRQRPKLTLELLQESKGIPDVQENFYQSMKSVFRGKGHEISDTRRLLELYRRWSDRVMPVKGRTETFDTFIVGVENLSTKAIVKDMMNRKREDLLKGARQASLLDQHEAAGEDDELLELAAGGDMGGSGPEDEDEELLELAGIKAAGEGRDGMRSGNRPSAGGLSLLP